MSHITLNVPNDRLDDWRKAANLHYDGDLDQLIRDAVENWIMQGVPYSHIKVEIAGQNHHPLDPPNDRDQLLERMTDDATNHALERGLRNALYTIRRMGKHGWLVEGKSYKLSDQEIALIQHRVTLHHDAEADSEVPNDNLVAAIAYYVAGETGHLPTEEQVTKTLDYLADRHGTKAVIDLETEALAQWVAQVLHDQIPEEDEEE